MDVALAADGFRVAELSGDTFDHFGEVAIRLAWRIGWTRTMQQAGREDGCRPSPEILAGEVLAGRFSQIIVDVRRSNIMPVALVIDVLKQFLAWEFLAAFHDSSETRVAQVDGMRDAAFSPELKSQQRA